MLFVLGKSVVQMFSSLKNRHGRSEQDAVDVFRGRRQTAGDPARCRRSRGGSKPCRPPEELTFVVGRWLRTIVFVLDMVHRLQAAPISSREQMSTLPDR
jgi:hypothetical protein